MNIDRHNYEEYFLLYIDNELTVEQKRQVDIFVKENPDLEEELIMLQQSRLIPDHTVVFDKKHLLIKEESNSSIDLNNYTEWLLSYIDNELNEDKKTAVEKFVVDHPHVQQELNLFQQTKLQPEKIVFADKEILYRRERTTVIRMQWLRVAAAVLLIISIGAALPFILNKRNNNNSVAKVVPTQQKKQSANSLKTTSPSNATVIAPIKPGEKVKDATVNEVSNTPVNKKIQQEQPTRENHQQLASNTAESDNTVIPQHLTSELNETTITETKMSDAVIGNGNLHKQIINDAAVTNASTTTPQISAGPTDPSVDPDEYASNTENKRLRGFFRKATRFIKHTTNINAANDDNRLLIGGMAINLK